MALLSISDAAAALRLSAHTLRYYERIGLLDPVARIADQRRYTERDIAWLRFIRRLRDTGMPMRQIDQYARPRRQGDGTLAARMALLERHWRVLLDRERELIASRQALGEKIEWYRRQLDLDEHEGEAG